MLTLEETGAMVAIARWWKDAEAGDLQWGVVHQVCTSLAKQALATLNEPETWREGEDAAGLTYCYEELAMLAGIAARHHINGVPPTQMYNTNPTEILA